MEHEKLPEFCWTSFWNWFLKQEPDASYQICTFGNNKLPYQWKDKLGFVVATKLTIRGETHLRYEPVRIRKYSEEKRQKNENQRSSLQLYEKPEFAIRETTKIPKDRQDFSKKAMQEDRKQRLEEQKEQADKTQEEECFKQEISAQTALSDINRAIIRCLLQNLLSFE